jgi:hypothetical protein
MNDLSVGVGTSEVQGSREAGRTAARAAREELKDRIPALVIVYASVAHRLPELLAGVREVTGRTPLIGCSTSGHFFDERLIPPGGGVVVLLLASADYRFGTASVTGLSRGGDAAGRELARLARDAARVEPGEHSCLVLLADGLSGENQPLLNGIYRVTGASVPVVGGAAGDDRHLVGTFVLHNDEVISDGAVAAWIVSPHPVTVVARHGWEPVSPPMMVTASDGTHLSEIGGRPALEVFREYFYDPEVAAPGTFRKEGYHSAHAFGLVEPDGSVLVRGGYLDGGRIRTFEAVPQYSAVQIITCTPDSVLEVTEPAVAEAVAAREASVLLVFSCVARYDLLQDRAVEEVKRLQAAAGDARVVGFYTYGEFARTTGVRGVHNGTISAVAL